MAKSNVRFVGSRELHRDLPEVLDDLDDLNSRYVLTIHSKPRAVLIGAEAFAALVRSASAGDRLLALQLEALLQGQRPKATSSSRKAKARANSPVRHSNHDDNADESTNDDSCLVALGTKS
jgi:PHD/YefM family antitoxin component YafN of YafNO toxin-antitoxin module